MNKYTILIIKKFTFASWNDVLRQDSFWHKKFIR